MHTELSLFNIQFKPMDNIKLDDFYKSWNNNISRLSDGYLYDDNSNLRPTRYIFPYFKNIINNFLSGKINELEKIILLPGIRGVGKTTLLMQIYQIEKFLSPDNSADAEILRNLKKLDFRFYFDVSKFHLEQITLNEFFKYFEKINNLNFVNLNKKIIILLDEIHFDEKWSLFLKLLFDSTKGHKNLLVIATGSSAINLKISADLMRRSTTTELFPMKFNEYLILKHNIYPINNLSDKLNHVLFDSQNAMKVFQELKNEEAKIDRYFIKLPANCEDDFFKSGGFPFVTGLKNEVEIAERIKNVINGIITKDIITLKKFKSETISKINDLLFLLANSDVITYEKLLKSLRIDSIRTLSSLLDTLVMSGIIVLVKSYGKTYGATRKTPKYLFLTPSLRSAILDNIYLSGIEGKKLEDYFALIFVNNLNKFFAHSLHYDKAEGGADFVLTLNDRSNIVIEVGFNKEKTIQVEKTMKKVKSRYGLVIGSNNLELVNNTIVKIPLKFFMLI
jgi:predicted AAA+ superfamily ATPase